MLAKLVVAYYDRRIDWATFCSYSEVINNILVSDLTVLENSECYKVCTKYEAIPASLLRLCSAGLMYSYQNDSLFDFDERGGFAITQNSTVKAENREIVYSITEYGKNLKSILFE